MNVVSGYTGYDIATPKSSGEAESEETPEVARRMLDLAAQSQGELFAIIDAARGEAVMQKLAQGGGLYTSLFDGTTSQRHFAVSPILAECREGSELLRWLTSDVWGHSYAFFIVSSSSQPELVTHFRRLVKVKTEQDEDLYFRFYDPRVLRIYLPTCTKAELEHFYGPSICLLVESEAASQILCYTKADPAAGKKKAKTKPTNKLGKFIVRDAQMAVFAVNEREKFERRMVTHLQQRFPDKCEPLGKEGVEEQVKFGIRRADTYGINTEIAVQEYLEMMMIYGRDFDVDPQCEWATRILVDPSFEHGKARADRLYEVGMSKQSQAAAERENS